MDIVAILTLLFAAGIFVFHIIDFTHTERESPSAQADIKAGEE